MKPTKRAFRGTVLKGHKTQQLRVGRVSSLVMQGVSFCIGRVGKSRWDHDSKGVNSLPVVQLPHNTDRHTAQRVIVGRFGQDFFTTVDRQTPAHLG